MRAIDIKTVTKLKDDEYLLKIYETENRVLGFMSKLNLNGTVPKAFENWQPSYREFETDCHIMTETFRSGWKIVNYRTGKSQDWVVMRHPLEFEVEIYMNNLFELIKNTNIFNMELDGKFKWENKKLIKEENGNRT